MKARVLAVVLVLVLLMGASSAAAQEQTIVEIAAGDANFSMLVSLVEAAGLTDMLASEGPYTVFAPTNDAFAALPVEVLEYLTANPEALTRVLNYHIISGVLMSADATTTQTTTADGSAVSVVVAEDGIVLDGEVNILTADRIASNGVLHAIDKVLIPPFALPPVDPMSMSGNIIAAGSSTVFPLSERMADLFNWEGFAGMLTVDSIGSGAGIERFCVAGEIDIANASRPIRSSEIEKCAAINRTPIEFQVGIDPLAVVVSANNTFAQNLTNEQLVAIFSGQVTTWDQVDPSFPAEAIQVFSPGSDSGTFDFFIEVVLHPALGDEAAAALLSVPGIQLSEDDNVLVQGIQGSEFAIGYFGFAYYLENTAALRAVGIEGVVPSAETVATYELTRPLFIYTDAAIMAQKPQVAAFVNFYLANVNNELLGGSSAEPIGYVPVPVRVTNLNALTFIAVTNTGV